MSFTKQVYENNIIKNVELINRKTLENNDLKPILDLIDNMLDIKEKIGEKAPIILGMWNEVVFDLLASINSAVSGFYRQAFITLRSVLELGCASFYYFDHQIEYHQFREHDSKADKYVSSLINSFNFFTSNYISAFFSDIKVVQRSNNSVSFKLNEVYKELSDIVHGRYKTLTKQGELTVEYNKHSFKFFQAKLLSTLSILCVMYVLRFNEKEEMSLIKLANESGVINL